MMFHLSIIPLSISLLLLAFLIIKFFGKIKKSKNLTNKFFFVFLLFLFVHILFKAGISFIGPDLDMSKTSKFVGSNDYLFLISLMVISNFALVGTTVFFVLTGLSLRGVKTIEHLTIIFFVILWFINLLFVDLSILYYPVSGWEIIGNETINLSYNLPLSLFLVYMLLNIFEIYFNEKRKEHKKRLKLFTAGSTLMVFGMLFYYMFLRQISAMSGIDTLILALSSIFFYKSFK